VAPVKEQLPDALGVMVVDVAKRILLDVGIVEPDLAALDRPARIDFTSVPFS
jgi:hypothetical protein